MVKLYFAGFDVFYVDALERFEKIKAYCIDKYIQPLIPFGIETTDSHDIFSANLSLLGSADGVIANLNPFRGKEPDSGTVFETGYAYANHKHIIGYTDIIKWENHVIGCSSDIDMRKNSGNKPLIDKDGFIIESYNNKLNLMLSESVLIINDNVFGAIDKYIKLYGE